MLVKSSQLLILDCKFEKVKFTETVGEQQTCTHTPINVSDNSVVLTASEVYDQIKQLSFLNNKISYLPKHIGKIFPNLLSFKVGSSELTKIYKEDFKGVHKLELLMLWGNLIEDIASDTFSELIELKELNLGMNQIKSIESGLFKNNLKLQKILLNVNKIKYISPNAFSDLKVLNDLYLKNNDCILKNYINITTKDLNELDRMIKNCETKPTTTNSNTGSKMNCFFGESIDNLYSCSIDKLKAPHDDDFIDNVIVTHVVGQKKTDIKLLKIIDSNTKNIRINLLIQFPSLSTLVIKQSKWTGIDKLFGAKQLTKLFINDNKDFLTLNADIFEGMTRMRTINLRNNGIKDINETAFAYLSKLQFLDLSYNQIVQIHEDLFCESTHLKKLSLAHNKIKILKISMFQLHRKLRDIYLDNNVINKLIKGPNDQEFYDALDMTKNECANTYYDRKSTNIRVRGNNSLHTCYNITTR